MTSARLLRKAYVLLSNMSMTAKPEFKDEIDGVRFQLLAECERLEAKQSPPPLGVSVSDGIDTKEKLR